MASVRRTISLAPAVAARLDDEARRRRMSFSALIQELATREAPPLPYAATVDDDADLSLRIEEILARLAR
jgi:predicted DNA-binding ribbon-helix-helix protein